MIPCATCWRARPNAAIISSIVPGSYVSAESALSYHGWIPDGFQTTISVTLNRKRKTVDAGVFGYFSFRPMAIRKGHFLELIHRIQPGGHVAWIASPGHALLDGLAGELGHD